MAEAKIKAFAIEDWMDKHEIHAKYNLAETCAASISVRELQEISEDPSAQLIDPSKKLDYGSIRGSDELRSNLARLYSARSTSALSPENILITSGAIAANMDVFLALLRKGDHVVCHYPTYQQLYEVPATLGAEVSLWKAREENRWELDVEELKGLIKTNTKLIVINNPNNPTGSILSGPLLQSLVEVASSHDPPIPILSDEVYRPLFHDPSVSPVSPLFPPSILSLNYDLTIATGSMSKAYSLAGLRTGWIASRNPSLIEAFATARHYTTISTPLLTDRIAAFALSAACIHRLLARNLGIARTNIALLSAWIEQHKWAAQWTKPVAGTTAFVKFSRDGKPVNDVEFCERLMERVGVLVSPGQSCFGQGEEFAGYVRVGFCCETEVLREGLERMGEWLREGFGEVGVVDA
ncbi:hypothetical protein G7Y79_00018g044510 [Physcia stellaris]|nr:hypothetical protein G7Y79_00018g044510 [Physcia stellaris]